MQPCLFIASIPGHFVVSCQMWEENLFQKTQLGKILTMASMASYNCLRFLVVSISLVFLMLLVLVVGVLCLGEMYTQFYGDSYTDTLILIGIIAAFTLLVLLGCWGALVQINCLVIFFTVILLALVVTQVVLAILVAFQVCYQFFLFLFQSFSSS